jgi:pyridoxamine 5'-phosphate oxidase
MSEPIPSFYNDLDETLAESWRLIARNGRPRLRTVILRACDGKGRILRFHTDVRSEKIGEIRRDPRVSLHFYEPSSKIQLRLEGVATVNTDNAVADAAWAESRDFSRQAYGIAPGPGTVIAAGADFTLPEASHEATTPARMNFCAVTVEIGSLEWLYLASSGHRRALFRWDSGEAIYRWIAP